MKKLKKLIHKVYAIYGKKIHSLSFQKLLLIQVLPHRVNNGTQF